MKHLHKTLIGSALTLALAGCNDFLDLSSYDEVSSGTAFSTTTLAESVVVGAYSNILYDYIDGTRSRLNWDAFSSVMDPSNSMVYLNYSYLTGTIQPNDASFLTYWKRFYEGVNRANDVINNIASCPTMSDALKRQRIAECKFLRAFHYYRLNCLWRGVPVYLENLAPGEYTRARSSEEQVWGVIIDDLNDCIACEELPGKYKSSDSDYGRVTKGAAYTLRRESLPVAEEMGGGRKGFPRSRQAGLRPLSGQLCRPLQAGQREVRRDDFQRPNGGHRRFRQRLQLHLRQHGHQRQRRLEVLHEHPLR